MIFYINCNIKQFSFVLIKHTCIFVISHFAEVADHHVAGHEDSGIPEQVDSQSDKPQVHQAHLVVQGQLHTG